MLGRSAAQEQHNPFKQVSVSGVGAGWAGNSINAVIFRKNAITSFGDQQFIAYYDNEGRVVLGKRKLADSSWQLQQTKYKGNIKDAHNSISIGVDGDGYLHVAWDQHNNALHYCRSTQPLSLELTDMMPMTGTAEKKVSYPEFYLQPSGGILFFYRDGASGNGNLVINGYSPATKKWTRIQHNLIDGETKRNAYWQACVDKRGFIHISWVWRETADVATNHDMSYALSKDAGKTWQRSTGEEYSLPITIANAEKIAAIPQNSELINQTSMSVGANGEPVIAGYWRGKNAVPQYQLVYRRKGKWITKDSGFRTAGFSLSGQGTKKIPMSRPQVISWGRGKKTTVAIIFRDRELGNHVSLAHNRIFKNNHWRFVALTTEDTGEWEPSYDTELWKNKQYLHLFLQKVTQADREGVMQTPPTKVRVLELSGLDD